MKKSFLSILLIAIVTILSAQTETFSKKDWKKFNLSFKKNLTAAQAFYSGNIDYENKNKHNFSPTSKVVLHKSTSNSINDMGYTCSFSYDFKTTKEAEEFYNSFKEKLKLHKTHQLKEDENGVIHISSKTNPGMYSTADVRVTYHTVLILFTPPLDVNIPMDVK